MPLLRSRMTDANERLFARAQFAAHLYRHDVGQNISRDHSASKWPTIQHNRDRCLFAFSMSKPNLADMRTLCANIGGAVVACQAAEKLINLSLQWLFPKEPIRNVEMLDQLEDQHRRRTLGHFIRALRDRVGLAPEFDSLLRDFLEHRNTLVHDLERVEGHTFATAEGFCRMNEYALRVTEEALRLTEIFAAFMDAWSDQIGVRDKLRAEQPDVYDSDFFKNIRETIAPLLDDLVHKKPDA